MKFRNICGRAINVACVPVQPDQVFDADNTQELKNLVQGKYLAKVE